MVKDNLGRVLMVNDPDVSMYSSTQDIYHYSAGDRRTINQALCIFFAILTTVTTVLRLYTRTKIIKARGIDDYALICSQLLFYIFDSFMIVELTYGTGLSRSQLRLDYAEVALKNWLFCAITYALATSAIKITIGLFLLRFTTHRLQDAALWLFIVASGAVGTAYFIFLSLTCHPLSFFWNLQPDAAGYCFTPATWLHVGYFVASANTLADVAFAGIPILIVYGTTMNTRTKIGACVLLGLGSVAVVATAIRIYYGSLFREYKAEFLHNNAYIALLSVIEVGLAICAANMATLRPLLRLWRGGKKEGTERRSKQGPQELRSNVRWVGGGGELQNASLHGGARWMTTGISPFASRKAASKQNSAKSASSNLTGRESIGGMPDLVFAREGEQGEERTEEEKMVCPQLDDADWWGAGVG